MKNLSNFINESLINEAKIKDVKTTVGDYVSWYYGVDNIDDVYLAEFESTDFDPSSLEENFDNIYSEQLKYLKQNKNTKIVIKQTETKYNDIEVEFTVNDITFYPVATDIFTGK